VIAITKTRQPETNNIRCISYFERRQALNVYSAIGRHFQSAEVSLQRNRAVRSVPSALADGLRTQLTVVSLTHSLTRAVLT
jgi:hypothetical protein